MLYYEEGDLLDGSYDIICHQVNCQGVMGAGLAKQIADKWPQVYEAYKEHIEYQKFYKTPVLGTIKVANIVENQKWCVNMFAQDKYGHANAFHIFTDYEAFQSCLNNLYETIMIFDPDNQLGWTIAFPYKIGCGLAGGNWLIIEPMIEEFSNKIKQDVIIVKKV